MWLAYAWAGSNIKISGSLGVGEFVTIKKEELGVWCCERAAGYERC